jgi:ABC-type Zn uptake system ZnuABC Zn-binding protein ZnuA
MTVQLPLLTEIRKFHAAAHNEMCKEDADTEHITFYKGAWLAYNNVAGLVEHMQDDVVTLTPTLITHYQQRSQETGKSVNALVLADLTALLKKRVARGEKRVWKENEYERL